MTDLKYWDYECLLLFEQLYREIKRVSEKFGMNTKRLTKNRDRVVLKWKEVHSGDGKSKKTPKQIYQETVDNLMLPIV